MQKNKIIPFSIILTALIVAGIIFASRTDLTVKQTKIFWTEKPENSRGIELNKFQRPDSLVELAKKVANICGRSSCGSSFSVRAARR